MARKTARPGRTLGVFFLGLAIAFGLVALAGTWKPELGLDLQGGTSIRLTPKGSPSAESLNEARKIIDQRVNGSGVAEAEVTVQGNKYIVVEIPGDSRRDLVETVKRQAQLRFRLVACSDSDPTLCQTGSTPTTPQDPTAPETNAPGTGVDGSGLAHAGRHRRADRRRDPHRRRHPVRERQPRPGPLRRRHRQPEPHRVAVRVAVRVEPRPIPPRAPRRRAMPARRAAHPWCRAPRGARRSQTR